MAAFEYIALNPRGKEEKGIIEADSIKQVRQLLRDKQLAPLTVSTTKDRSSDTQPRFSLQVGKRISAHQLALITRQLATLIQAGMPIEEVLKAVADQNDQRKIKAIILSVRSRVLEGYSLANSMADFPQVFPNLYRATVSAGEQSGHLNLVLNRLADYTEDRKKSRQKIQLALVYPIILLCASLLIVGFLLGYVVPDIVKVFINSKQQLPVLTEVIIAASDWVKSSWYYVAIIGVLTWMGYRYGMRNDSFKKRVHRFWLKLPVMGKLLLNMETARFISTLSILVRSGVPLVDALHIAVEVIDNLSIKHQVKDTALWVSEGNSLRKALERTNVFPPMILHMVASGESSGELDDMLGRAAENQQQEVEGFVAMLVGLFEPMMLLFMGAVVLVIVLAVLLPILNLNALVV
ncbi:type II secretion system inner membrane protein GspF [Zooshikella harenae]|uniref:General secretion pathway protein F n=1 Tax=Zooshikella harenae TaxID=2827238 RepID=A0ABS5ZFZ4_9GAMM|nr:type II secretion system inner membrane protein GspF [Zooshikella harenae]MBU2712201.1 type II secretion system inner membrane protein GspF [Zooshikella harenae]